MYGETGAALVYAHHFYKGAEHVATGNDAAKLAITTQYRQSINLMLVQIVSNIFNGILAVQGYHRAAHNILDLQTT